MLPEAVFAPLPASPALPEEALPSGVPGAAPAWPSSPQVQTDPDASLFPVLDPEWHQAPAAEYLANPANPDRPFELKLTYTRKEMFLEAFPESIVAPESLGAASFLLFLCANPRTVWTAPVPDPEDPGVFLRPLHTRLDSFMDYIDGWKDRVLREANPYQVLAVARRLWLGQHANRVVVPGASEAASKKKLMASDTDQAAACPLPASSAGLSPEGIPAAPIGSSMNVPFGNFTATSTHACSSAG